MKNVFVFYSLIAWTFYTYIVVIGNSTEDCDNKYRHLSGDCRPTCKSKGAGFHRTFSCNHYCFCRDDRDIGKHRTCPDGMVFNHLIEHCDYPENYQCPERPVVPTNYKCPKPEGLFEYPGCCVLFIICDHDTPKTFFCSANTHFSEETKKCEYPENAGCANKIRTNPTEVTTRPTEVTKPVTSPIPTVFKCPRPFGNFPDINNCNKFFQCAYNIASHQQCGSGTDHFNPLLRICDFPYRAACQTGKDAKVISEPIGNCSREGEIEGEQNDCSKFYICYFGQLFLETCPEGFIFIQGQKSCERKKTHEHVCPEENSLIEKSCSCQNCNIPDPQDCRQYFRCIGGKARREKCYLGQTFRTDINQCDLVEGREC